MSAFIRITVTLAVALSIAGTAFASGSPEPQGAESLLVSVEELQERLDDSGTLVLDARDYGDYASGSIPGAVSLPTNDLNRTVVLDDGTEIPRIVQEADEIVYALQDAGINTDSRIVIYDQGGSTLAPRLFWILDYYGHTDLAILDGGFSAWQASGLEVSAEIADIPRGDFIPVANPEKHADFEYVTESLGSDSTMVCNALSESSFAEAAIPGSTNLPQANLFATDGVPYLKQAEVLETLLNDIGFDRSKEIVFYCGAGYAASVDYFVAQLIGLPRVRMYDGSLQDWRAREGELLPSGGA